MNNVQTIEEIFTGRILKVPDYQRGYAWEKRQWDDFLEDLDLLEPGREHYTGTLVLHAVEGARPMRDKGGLKYEHFHVVDGQQRLTTTVLLLDSVRRSMKDIEGLDEMADGIRSQYISVLALGSEQLTHKLQLNEDSHSYFVNSVLSDEPGPQGPTIYSHERLMDARTHFEDYLEGKREELGDGYGEWLLELHDKITASLKVSLYNVSSASEVGVIFEVMNNRGKPLSELEKVKNYILYISSKLNVDDHDLDRQVNETWAKIFRNLMEAGLTGTGHEDQLLRAHWMVVYDYVKKNWDRSRSIKACFSLRKYRDSHVELLRDLTAYCRSLADASVAYCDVASPRRDNAFSALRGNPALRRSVIDQGDKLRRINVVSTFLPLLVATRLRDGSGEKYLRMVEICEVFAFRVYRLLRYRANTGESMLRRLGHQVYNGHVSFEEAVEHLRGSLLYYCPNPNFEESFVLDSGDNNWYSWPGLRYFLYEYEEYLAQGDEVQLPWEAVEKRGLESTVEHILPQTPTDRYWTSKFKKPDRTLLTHDLGNLCLTYHNSTYGNKPFPVKKGYTGAERRCYANSSLFMEKRLAALDDWTKEALLERREQMVAWALERWSVRESTPEAPDPEEDMEDDAVLAESI